MSVDDLIGELRAGLRGVIQHDAWQYVERPATDRAPADAMVVTTNHVGGVAVTVRPLLLSDEAWRATGKHIARCSPDAIRLLLDHIASLEASVDARLASGREETARLAAERDEADRRAGAAERQMEGLKQDAYKRVRWLDEAKEERGYSRNVSFDTVWADTCAKADRAAAAEAANETLRAALDSAAPP